MLLTKTQVSKTRKAFASGSSANIKCSKNHFFKIVQSGGFLGRVLGSLLKTELSLIENALKPLAKRFLIPLGLTGFTTLIISNEEMNDIMKIVKPLKESGILKKDVSETIKNEAKD